MHGAVDWKTLFPSQKPCSQKPQGRRLSLFSCWLLTRSTAIHCNRSRPRHFLSSNGCRTMSLAYTGIYYDYSGRVDIIPVTGQVWRGNASMMCKGQACVNLRKHYKQALTWYQKACCRSTASAILYLNLLTGGWDCRWACLSAAATSSISKGSAGKFSCQSF